MGWRSVRIDCAIAQEKIFSAFSHITDIKDVCADGESESWQLDHCYFLFS